MATLIVRDRRLHLRERHVLSRFHPHFIQLTKMSRAASSRSWWRRNIDAVAGEEPASKRRVTPFSQGDLNSMCGIYAIVNPLRFVYREITEKIRRRLFRYLVRSLSMPRRLSTPEASGSAADFNFVRLDLFQNRS